MIQILILVFTIILFFDLLNKHYKDLYNIEGFQSNTVVEIDDGFTDYDLELAKLKQVRHVRDQKIDNDFNPDITGEYKDKYLSDYEGDGIFYNEPLKQNSRFINKLSDEGVLKNFRIESDINSYSKEIYYDDMVKIIEKIARKKDYNINIINPINLEGTLNEKEIQDKVVDKFIEEVNNTFTELNLENKYHKYDERKFKLLNHFCI